MRLLVPLICVAAAQQDSCKAPFEEDDPVALLQLATKHGGRSAYYSYYYSYYYYGAAPVAVDDDPQVEYVIAQGQNTCPEGSIPLADAAACEAAAPSLQYGNQRNGRWEGNRGNDFGFMPPGCVLYTGWDSGIHEAIVLWNNKQDGNNDGNRAVVCQAAGADEQPAPEPVPEPEPEQPAFPNPAVFRNAESGRRIYAQDPNNPENGDIVGAYQGDRIYSDQKWIITDVGNGKYVIINRSSNRRLFAQAGHSGENGVGATADGEVFEDQKWFIEPAEDGKYIVRNAFSDRRLFAQSNKQGANGYGASNGETIYNDQKWFIDPGN